MTFFCEADFITFVYFLIEFSDHSACFKYQILAYFSLCLLAAKNNFFLLIYY